MTRHNGIEYLRPARLPILLLVTLLLGSTTEAAGTHFKDCSACPEMVVIHPDRFIMGSPVTEPGRHDGERQHAVTIARPFAIGRFDVTVAEFAVFARATHFTQPHGGCFDLTGLSRQIRLPRTWDDPGFHQTPTDPVVCIAWSEARAYTSWLSRLTGQVYRLPTETEWEYAARAGTTSARFWGDAIDHGHANYGAEDCCAPVATGADHWEYTSPGGSFPPNRFGLSDMLGNVWVWLEDCSNDGYNGAPTDGSAWLRGDCSARMRRGGGWLDPPFNIRSASRFWIDNNHRSADSGIRVVRDLGR